MDGHIEHISSSNVGWAGAKGFWIVGNDISLDLFGLAGFEIPRAVEPNVSRRMLELFWRLAFESVGWGSPAVAGIVRSRFSCCGALLTASGLACVVCLPRSKFFAARQLASVTR